MGVSGTTVSGAPLGMRTGRWAFYEVMARIDQILAIVVHQGADELRLGTDREPQMLAQGVLKRLAMPAMPDPVLRQLLGDMISPAREEELRARGKMAVDYETEALGNFTVTFADRGADGFDVVFARKGLSSTKVTTPVAATVEVPARRISASVAGIDDLVKRAAAMRASDLHLADDDVPSIRVDGLLRRFDDRKVKIDGLMDLDGESKARLATEGSVDVALDVPAVGRVRANVYRTAGGLAAAVRLLPPEPPSLSSLDMPVSLHDLVEFPHGLVLFCGATGSGKSTTLAALAQHALARRPILLITLEDPIEYHLHASEESLVRRRQVGRDVRDFASGLRAALREDPDVLMVGELRDPETIQMALTAAETGHLVLSSLHSGSAASAIERMVDAYPSEQKAQVRGQLADSLRAVVAQRLVRRARGAGRVPAIEVLRVTHAVANLVREGKTAQIATALQSGRREGMLTMERCLADHVLAGTVRRDDARAAANDPESFDLLFCGRE